MNSLKLFTLSIILSTFSLSANKNELLDKHRQFSASSRGFLENKGQMLATDGKPIPFVLFKTSAPNINMYLTKKGITYSFLKFEEFEDERGERGNYPNRKSIDGEFLARLMDMVLVGANILEENILKHEPLEGEYNYYLSHCTE